VRALAVGVLWAVGCWITEARDDLLSSPLWIWGWVLLPLAAVALARTGEDRAAVIGAGLCAPMAVAFVLHGDPANDPGPASWPIGVLLVLALGGICVAAAATVRRATAPSADEPEEANGSPP
jgi:hypothetical protein